MSVGVVGIGYVGMPLVVGFAEAGERVVAVDIDPRKVAALKAGESYVEDISSERLKALLPMIDATSHYAPLARTDAALICVPTPLTPNREPDLGALRSAGRALGQVLQRGQLVVRESTTYPGTTREELVPLLEQESQMQLSEHFNVAFSPERVDPGRTDYTLRPLRGADRAGAERAGEADQGVPDHDPRRQLQGRRRRPARITRAADHAGALRARCRAHLPRPLRPCTARPRPAKRPARAGHRRRGRSRAGHRPPGHRLHRDRQATLFIDLRGVTRGIDVENLVRL